MGIFSDRADERNQVEDGREIEDSTLGTNLGLDNVLSRELVVRKDALFRTEQDTWKHGLSRLGVALSDTLRGDTTRLVPCEEGVEGAEVLTFNPPFLGDPVTCWFRRVPLAGMEEVAVKVMSLTDERFEKVRVRYGAATREELIRRFPSQERPPMILEKKAYALTGTALDRVPYERLKACELAFTTIGEAHRKGEPIQSGALEIIKMLAEEVDVKVERLYPLVMKLTGSHLVRIELLGSDVSGQDHDLDVFDPEPQAPCFWGVPVELLLYSMSSTKWNDFVMAQDAVLVLEGNPAFDEDGGPAAYGATAEIINRLSMNQSGVKLLDIHPERVPRWKELQAAIKKVEETFRSHHEEWLLRRDPTARWMNLGEITNRLGDVLAPHDLLGQYELTDTGYEARPRPGFMDEEPAEHLLGEADDAYLKKQVNQSASADDVTVFMGDCGPLASSLPIINRKVSDGMTISSGHPMARVIQEMMDIFGRDANPLMTGVSEDASEMVRLCWKRGSIPVVDHLVPTMTEVESEDGEFILVKGVKKVKALALEAVFEGAVFFSLVSAQGWFRGTQEILSAINLGAALLDGEKKEASDVVSPGKHQLSIHGESFTVMVERGALVSWVPGLVVSEVLTSGDSESALVHVLHPLPAPGFRHALYYMERGYILPINADDPLLELYPIGDEDMQFSVLFRSFADWKLTTEAMRKVPVISGASVCWCHAKDVWPRLFNFLNELLDCWHEGVTMLDEGDKMVSSGLLCLNLELQLHRQQALGSLVKWNYPIVESLVGDLEMATWAASVDYEEFKRLVFQNAWGKMDYPYRALLRSGSGSFWANVRKVQGNSGECALELPHEAWAEDSRPFWKAMGYLLDPNKILGVSHAFQMVSEQFYRNPLQSRGMKYIDGRLKRNSGLGKWLQPWQTSCGIVGDKRHQLLQIIGTSDERWSGFFPTLPAWELLRPSNESFEAADGNYERALRGHLYRVFKQFGWKNPKAAFEVLKGWGRVPDRRSNDRIRNHMLLSMMSHRGRLVLPSPPRDTELTHEDVVDMVKDLTRQGRESVFSQRVQAISVLPKLVGKFLHAITRVRGLEDQTQQVRELIAQQEEVLGSTVTNLMLKRLSV